MYSQKKLVASVEEHPHFLGASGDSRLLLWCVCSRFFYIIMSDVVRLTYVSCLVKIQVSYALMRVNSSHDFRNPHFPVGVGPLNRCVCNAILAAGEGFLSFGMRLSSPTSVLVICKLYLSGGITVYDTDNAMLSDAF
jgi:hypothetical protein